MILGANGADGFLALGSVTPALHFSTPPPPVYFRLLAVCERFGQPNLRLGQLLLSGASPSDVISRNSLFLSSWAPVHKQSSYLILKHTLKVQNRLIIIVLTGSGLY